MNAQDRKEVGELLDRLDKVVAEFSDIKELLRELADAEQEKFDNMSEGLQQSEKGQAIQEAATELGNAADADSPEEAFRYLQVVA